MKNFLKNNGQWLRAIVIFAAVIFAAGKICSSYIELCRKVEVKVDKEIYELQINHITEQLNRIEGKVDAIIDREYQKSAQIYRNP
jgi:hypothetical protein